MTDTGSAHPPNSSSRASQGLPWALALAAVAWAVIQTAELASTSKQQDALLAQIENQEARFQQLSQDVAKLNRDVHPPSSRFLNPLMADPADQDLDSLRAQVLLLQRRVRDLESQVQQLSWRVR
jgi:cell division protein FtsB